MKNHELSTRVYEVVASLDEYGLTHTAEVIRDMRAEIERLEDLLDRIGRAVRQADSEL